MAAVDDGVRGEGVLHRDLKPANVMLDGRGRVKLTDFGLSAVAEVRAGTPIYMAPEQLAGEAVSVQSDLFALGLVLHEVFTGKRVFEAGDLDQLRRAHERSTTASLTSTSDLDPAIDRVINRCLAPDPAHRPKSALAVAAGLPGADPLVAALAAGETPSSEMVAEAGGEGKLPPMYAIPLLVVAVVGTLAYGAFMQRRSDLAYVPFDEAYGLGNLLAYAVLLSLTRRRWAALAVVVGLYALAPPLLRPNPRRGATSSPSPRSSCRSVLWRGSDCSRSPSRSGPRWCSTLTS